MKSNQGEEAQLWEHIAEPFAANVIWPFSWSFQCVILLDFKGNNIPAKAVYSPGCAGVAVSYYFAENYKLKPHQIVPLKLSFADGVKTINGEVFDSFNVKWKETDVSLPAVVLPGAGFNVLLGLSGIVKAGVSLDAERCWLINGTNKYTFKYMVIPELQKEGFYGVIYVANHFGVPAGGKAKLVSRHLSRKLMRGWLSLSFLVESLQVCQFIIS